MEKLPDIIKFCESDKYLNFNYLYPNQKLILKLLYRGSLWNEDLVLSEEEDEFLYELKQSDFFRGSSQSNVKEMTAVLGRRSGKNVLDSIACSYAIAQLLSCPGGCPFKYYSLAPGNPVYVMGVTASSDMARILFTEIKDRITRSEYFKNKIDKIDADRIHFLTEDDKSRQLEQPSVVLMSGQSNSDAWLGKKIYFLSLNEIDSFRTTGGALCGSRVYSALKVATSDFINPKTQKCDSKILMASSPKGNGFLWELWTKPQPDRIAIRLPTWKMNLRFSRLQLRREFDLMDSELFNCEFGANFKLNADQNSDALRVEKENDMSITVSMRMSSNQLDALKRYARKIAYERDEEITYLDLIRWSVEEKYFNNMGNK